MDLPAESQLRYRELFDRVPIGLYRTTLDGHFLEANVALAEMLGFPDAASLAATRWKDLWVEPADWDRWLASIERDGVVGGFETRVRGADGVVRWLVVEARAISDEDGQVRWHEGSALDFTERRSVEEALRASEARKGAMLEAAIDAVITMDDAGRIIEFSPAAERTFGHRRDAVIGKELADVLIPPDLRDHHRGGLARYLATGEAAMLGRRVELRAVRADGQEIPVEVAINRIDVPGPPTFTGYVRDISAQRRLEESLRQAQKMDAIGRLAGGVAHDFNNMLTVIDGFSTLLLDELDTEDARRELVEEIQRATGRAASLTGQLMAVSRRQALRLQAVDLNKLITALQPLLGRMVVENVVVVVRTADEPVVVDIDDSQFEQVVLNLAFNARDAMPGGGTLTIETGIVELDAAYAAIRPGVTPGSYAVLVVSDTGLGMDRATQARIFEPFFTTKDVGKGTGLGLAMIYGTVQQSGGHIGVESEPDYGTSVRIYLPLIDAIPAEQAKSASPPRRRLGPGVTVLVIEDEDQVRELMVRALQKAGCTVITAADAAEALAAVDPAGRLDLAVTDVIMPGASGPDVVRQLRRTRPRLRALYVSGFAPRFATSAASSPDLEPHFLQKPFTLTEFIDAVRKVLDAPGDGNEGLSWDGQPLALPD